MGIIDRIDCRKGEYYLTDYKSKENYVKKFELALYAMVVNDSNLLDKDIEFVGAYGYKTGMEKIWKIKELIDKKSGKHWFDLVKERVEILQNLTEDDEYWPIRGHYCDWCGYQERCENNGIEEYISGV